MKKAEIWSNVLSRRLTATRNLTRRERALLVDDALSKSCFRPKWPFGMPTSVNPWLLMLGISPGAGPDDNRDERTAEQPPTIGEPSPSFGGPYVREGKPWDVPYWDKARKLATGVLQGIQPSCSDADCLSMAGHLNLGLRNQGASNDAAVEVKIARWVSSIIADPLKPRLMVGFGLMGKIRGENLRKAWKGSPLETVVAKAPSHVHPFPVGKKTYYFRIWEVDAGLDWPILFTVWPNHLSRVPFGGNSTNRHFNASINAFNSLLKQNWPEVFDGSRVSPKSVQTHIPKRKTPLSETCMKLDAAFLRQSVYFPASAFNGETIRLLSKDFQRFVYVDINGDEDQIKAEFQNGCLGYDPVEVSPTNAVDILLRQGLKTDRELTGALFWGEFVRSSGYGSEHGPERFIVAYIVGDCFTWFHNLYLRNCLSPAVMVIHNAMGVPCEIYESDAFFYGLVVDNRSGQPDIVVTNRDTGWGSYDRPIGNRAEHGWRAFRRSPGGALRERRRRLNY